MSVAGFVLTIGLAGLAWVWFRQPEQRRSVVATVAVAGLSFQALHAVEHVLQIGAWVAAPGRKPFLTPWAAAGRDALAVGGNAAIGEELLHLGGNLIFLVGLVAFAALVQRSSRTSRSARFALVAQGLHVLEHVALTATAGLFGRSIGVTSGFGLLEPGPALWTVRPMAHLTLNMIATIAAAIAVLRFTQDAGLGSRQPQLAGS